MSHNFMDDEILFFCFLYFKKWTNFMMFDIDRPTSRQKPVPLNTIELQKRCSRYFRLSSEKTMQVNII